MNVCINIIVILECSENKVVSLKIIDLIDDKENNIIDEYWLLFYIILQRVMLGWHSHVAYSHLTPLMWRKIILF